MRASERLETINGEALRVGKCLAWNIICEEKFFYLQVHRVKGKSFKLVKGDGNVRPDP